MELGGYIYLYDEFHNELEYGKYWTREGRKKIMDKWVEKHGKLASYFQFYPKILNSALYAVDNNRERRQRLRERINKATNHVKE